MRVVSSLNWLFVFASVQALKEPGARPQLRQAASSSDASKTRTTDEAQQDRLSARWHQVVYTSSTGSRHTFELALGEGKGAWVKIPSTCSQSQQVVDANDQSGGSAEDNDRSERERGEAIDGLFRDFGTGVVRATVGDDVDGYYARHWPLCALQLHDTLTHTFPRLHNTLHTDFDVFSTYADIENGANAWQHCSYGDVPFPHNCAPTSEDARIRQQAYTELCAHAHARRTDSNDRGVDAVCNASYIRFSVEVPHVSLWQVAAPSITQLSATKVRYTSGAGTVTDFTYDNTVDGGGWVKIAQRLNFKRLSGPDYCAVNAVFRQFGTGLVKYVIGSQTYNYYRRVSDPTWFDLYFNLANTWTHTSNILHVDFEMYGTYAEALRGVNKWQYCNYDLPGVGYPCDCGRQAYIPCKWTDLNSDYPYLCSQGTVTFWLQIKGLSATQQTVTAPPSSVPPQQAISTNPPTLVPTPSPSTSQPSRRPTPVPTAVHSDAPTSAPSPQPTPQLTPLPTGHPSPTPTTDAPSEAPSPSPTIDPTPMPTARPSPAPSPEPTEHPSHAPSPSPTPDPTLAPTPEPSAAPTPRHTTHPSQSPSPYPTSDPTPLPTAHPSPLPQHEPTSQPSPAPTPSPTLDPTPMPTAPPSPMPTSQPTTHPSSAPNPFPTPDPTAVPTIPPEPQVPQSEPGTSPTAPPTAVPTAAPTEELTTSPTGQPSTPPTNAPTRRPTPAPTLAPLKCGGPQGYFAISSHTNKATAQQLCQAQGGTLAMPKTSELQMGEFYNCFFKNARDGWIGLSRQKDGTFMWDDGTALTDTKWNFGEPNNRYNRENCVEFYQGWNGWNDMYCEVRLAALCQKPATAS